MPEQSARFSVTLEDGFGTRWSTPIIATSPEEACTKAESEAAGTGEATAVYADAVESGERHHVE